MNFSGVIISIFALFFFSGSNLSGQRIEKPENNFFDNSEVIELTIAFDIKVLFRDRGENPGYHPGLLSFSNEDGNQISIDIGIRARGDFRKDPLHCDFPPLKIDFSKEEVEHTIF